MQRVEGNSDKLLAPPGTTEQQPLHVVMVFIFVVVSSVIGPFFGTALHWELVLVHYFSTCEVGCEGTEKFRLPG